MSEPAAFRRIRRIVEGQTVSLLGSAPGSYDASLFPPDQPLVCINAASLGIIGQRTPEITIINSAVAGSPNAGKPTRELLKHISTRTLIIVESGVQIEKAKTVFEPIKREETEIISIDDRCNFLEKFLGKPLTGRVGGMHVPSTGFFSCLVMFACGASRVRTFGLSFDDGHSYLNEMYKREHIERDRDILNWLMAGSFPIEFSPELLSARLLHDKTE